MRRETCVVPKCISMSHAIIVAHSPPHSHYELNRVAVKLIWLTSVEQAYIVDSSFDLSFV